MSWPGRHRSVTTGSVAFRIDARVVPNTSLVVLSRWEKPQRRAGREPANWHLSFHEANTLCVHAGSDRTPGCHRVIKYAFGGLRLMVKSDVGAALPWDGLHPVSDGCIMDARPVARLGHEAEDIWGAENEEDTMSIDTDVNTVETTQTHDPYSFSIHDLKTALPPRTLSSGISIIPSPIPHPPQGHLISLKTREQPSDSPYLQLGKINHLPEVFAGLFFGQIHHLYLGVHLGGQFKETDQRYIMGQGTLAILEKQYEGTIRRVREVLGWMLRVTRKYGRVGFVGWNGEIVAYQKGKVERGREDAGGEKFSEETWRVIKRSGIVYRRR